MQCPCGSSKAFSECCEPIIRGTRPAATAEELMRSRYSAFTQVETDYLGSSLHPDQRKDFNKESSRQWASSVEWKGFEILKSTGGSAEDTEGEIEFVASFLVKGVPQTHHEIATFRKHEDRWYFYDGETVGRKPFMREAPKVGRNDICPCGSGKKFKKCCGVSS